MISEESEVYLHQLAMKAVYGPDAPVVCMFKYRTGKICGEEPTKFFKHLKTGVYVGFCDEHGQSYPDSWSAFKPVSRDEVVTYEVMDS